MVPYLICYLMKNLTIKFWKSFICDIAPSKNAQLNPSMFVSINVSLSYYRDFLCIRKSQRSRWHSTKWGIQAWAYVAKPVWKRPERSEEFAELSRRKEDREKGWEFRVCPVYKPLHCPLASNPFKNFKTKKSPIPMAPKKLSLSLRRLIPRGTLFTYRTGNLYLKIAMHLQSPLTPRRMRGPVGITLLRNEVFQTENDFAC